MTAFSHLHVHTQYSILDGASNIPHLIEKVKTLGMEAVAITDHGNMFGVKEFHANALKKGIKPIIGCEIYVAKRSIAEMTGKEDRSGDHLILLAKNMTGYKNLIKLVSIAWIKGFYYKPRIDKELLARYKEGLIASSACLAGEIQDEILNGTIDGAEKALKSYLTFSEMIFTLRSKGMRQMIRKPTELHFPFSKKLLKLSGNSQQSLM